MLTPVPAIEAGLGFLGADVGLRITPVALESALPGREPGVVSPDRVSVYIDGFVQADGRASKERAMEGVLCDSVVRMSCTID